MTDSRLNNEGALQEVIPGPEHRTKDAPDPQPPRGPIDWYIHIMSRISLVCGWFAAAAIAVSVLIVCQLVFMRYVLRESTVWQTETVIYLMIASVAVGMPYVQSRRGHVNVDLLPLYLPRRARAVLYYICLLLGLGVCALVVFYSAELVREAYVGGWRSASIWRPQLWIPYLALPIGFGLMFLQLLADLLAVATGRDTPFGLPDEIENPLALRQEH
jgi:TRAP-type C4-dicarboxylate transport system permease small subunit